MAWLPEVAVQTTFLSAGLHFGSILHLPFIQVPEEFQLLQTWPLLVAVVSAAVTTALIYILKRNSKREMFRQPLLLIIGVLCLQVSGIPFFYPGDSNFLVVGTVLASIGHGMIYIAGLSFINLRVSSRCRSSRIAMAHFWYQLGCAVAAQLLQRKVFDRDFAITMTFITAVNVILLLTNELFQYFKVYDYKCCLDETLNAVNKQGLLLYDRKEIIDTLRANTNSFPEGYTLLVSEVKRRWKITPLLLALKVQSFFFYAVPIKYLIFAYGMQTFNFLIIEWIKLFGVVVFMLMAIFISARKLQIVFNGIQIICLSAALILISQYSSNYHVPILMYYSFIGVIYPVGDIALMDMSNFSTTEVHLFIGFAIEKILIVIFLFAFYTNQMLINADTLHESFFAYGSSFIVYSALMLVLVIFVYRNTHGMSLYTIRKEMLGIRMVKRSEQEVVPTVLPPVDYNFPGDKRRQVLMRNLSSSPDATAAGSRSPPVFVGGMNNRYDMDLQRMTPAAVLPRAIIGGAILSSITFNM